jgi:membrane protease YdiL (CAAX protease family)
MMENLPEQRPLSPFPSVLLFTATIFLSFLLIGPLIGFLVALPFYSGNFFSLLEEMTNGKFNEETRLPLLIMQGCATAIGLIAIPAMAYQLIVRMKFARLFTSSSILVLGITACAVVTFMFPNSVIIEWNAGLKFSGSFWSWARELEDNGEKLTKFITDFQSVSDFILVFIVVAVLPAIGEEFAFRGWLQPALHKLFSAFHFQFFGFVPRMLLGAMFGYMMFWSNNLWVPISAHFVNNGFSVVMMYLYQQKVMELDPASTESLPLMYVIPFTALFAFLMIYLKKIIGTREKATQSIQ